MPNVVADVMLADKWYGKGKIDNDLTVVMRLYIMGQMVCSHLQRGKNLGITYVTGVKPNDKVVDIDQVDDFAYATGSRSVQFCV